MEDQPLKQSHNQLHNRAARGEALTELERAQLDAWYERQDSAEAAMLAASAPGSLATLDSLREELAAALTRLRAETQRIQAQTDANEALRRENAALSEKLARTEARQAA